MTENILILARAGQYQPESSFEKVFGSIGEFVNELSMMYTILKERTVDMILVDERYPGLNPGVIKKIRRRAPRTDVWGIVVSGYDRDISERAPYDGLIDFSTGKKAVRARIDRILSQRRLLKKFGMVGLSEHLKVVAETIDRIAPTDVSVLVVGPSGAGKELVARAIHDNSSRTGGQYVAINCGALAEGVLESELFGHERGAFTGSVGRREGLFKQADGGTIFLDEIGETKPDMQVKLLRVLEDGVFYPVGSDKSVRSNVRVVAATNRDLNDAIRDGHFREDLYFRLGVVKIYLPPLYDRRADILPLLCHFAAQEGFKGFSDGAIDLLYRYDWPGNIRQLRNFVTRVAALKKGEEISADDVEQFINEQGIGSRNLPVITGHTPEEAGHELIYRALISLGNEVKMLKELILANLPPRHEVHEAEGTHEPIKPASPGSVMDMEKELIAEVLKTTSGNRREAARRLGLGERTLYRKLKKYNLN